MDVFSNAFEKKWFWVFTVLFVVIMIPLPFFYVERYIPSLWGLPLFIVGWTVHTLVAMFLIFVFYIQAMKRPEYHEFDEK
jgi:Na+-driven multidrug efflux pump